MSDIWKETIEEAFAEAEIEATQDQMDTVISAAEGMHENYGLYSGSDCIPNPVHEENKDLKRKLRKALDTVDDNRHWQDKHSGMENSRNGWRKRAQNLENEIERMKE